MDKPHQNRYEPPVQGEASTGAIRPTVDLVTDVYGDTCFLLAGLSLLAMAITNLRVLAWPI